MVAVNLACVGDCWKGKSSLVDTALRGGSYSLLIVQLNLAVEFPVEPEADNESLLDVTLCGIPCGGFPLCCTDSKDFRRSMPYKKLYGSLDSACIEFPHCPFTSGG